MRKLLALLVNDATSIKKLMPALRDLGLANLDAALVRLGDDIALRPVSELRLVSGGTCSDRHRIAYNKLTAFLHGDDDRKESIKDNPEAQRVVRELNVLAGFCKADPACASEESGLTHRTENRPASMAEHVAPRRTTRLLEHIYHRQSKAAQKQSNAVMVPRHAA